LDAAYQHYLEHHFQEAGALQALLDVDTQTQAVEPMLIELGTDLGVQDFLGTSVPDLVKMVGLPTGATMFPFAEPGRSASLEGEEHVLAKSQIVPEWHQWVGTLCLVRSWFTTELGEKPLPSMLCDEVGLGKTIQLVGSICILVHYIECMNQSLDLPPLLTGKHLRWLSVITWCIV
jgi:hypothetical protein